MTYSKRIIGLTDYTDIRYHGPTVPILQSKRDAAGRPERPRAVNGAIMLKDPLEKLFVDFKKMGRWYYRFVNDPGIEYSRDTIVKQTGAWIRKVEYHVRNIEVFHKINSIFDVEKVEYDDLARLLQTVHEDDNWIEQFQRFACLYKYWAEYAMKQVQPGFVPLIQNPIDKDRVKIQRPKGRHHYGS